MSLPTTVYSDLLESLYAATLDESQWQVFLSRLCEATRSSIGFLVRNDNGKGSRVLASGGSTPPAGMENYSSDAVREAFLRAPRAGVVEVEDFLPYSQLAVTEQYPLMASVGAHYGTCIVPTLSTRRYELIALWRGTDRPRLEPDLAEMLDLLLPHLRNALRIQQALGAFRERADTAEALLDASSTASLLLSASGRLLYMNKAAQQLAAEKDGLLQRNGRVFPAWTEHKVEWDNLIAAAAGSHDPAGGAMLLKRGGGKASLQVLINPFPEPGTRRSSRVLVLASEPDRAARLPDTVLRQLYGLTTAETEVANGLLTGFSPEAVAGIRGVSVGTVRTQIKSLFAKTDTRRQADLMRLLHALPRA